MKILMLSRDPAVKDATSDTAQRLREYHTLVKDIHVALFDSRQGALFQLWELYREGKAFITLEKEEKILITAQDPFEVGLIGYLLHVRYRVPLQLQVHTDMFNSYFFHESFKNRIRIRIAKYILKRSNCVRVVSERVKRSIIENAGVQENHVTTLPVYVDMRTYQEGERVDDEHTIIFLMVSRLTREKNISLAIQAFAEIIKKHNDVRLTIVGDGPEKKNLEILVLKLNLQPFIKFIGIENNVAPYYQQASCYVLSSNYEGYARTVVEALVSGAPVIMTDVGVAGEIIQNEQNGLVVPVGDQNALSEAMMRIVEDKELRTRLSAEGRKVKDVFPAKEEYLRLYKKSWETCA